MANQHYYTRSDKGLYSKLAGYDTIEATKDLTESYVKNNVHRFCFYEMHNFYDDEKDAMPNIYFCSKVASFKSKSKNEYNIIFGKNAYVKDVRGCFYSHSIIISSTEEIKYALENYELILNYNDFEFKPPLNEINFLSLEKENIFISRKLVFSYLGINEAAFSKLLYCCVMSFASKKIVYVKLNCKRNNCSEMARRILTYIFKALPPSIRKSLSFITYTPILKLPNYFNIVFVDKKTDLSSVSNDFVVDLTASVLFNIESDYINFYALHIMQDNVQIVEKAEVLFQDFVFNANSKSGNIMEQLNKHTAAIKLAFKRYLDLFCIKETRSKIVATQYFTLLCFSAELISLNDNLFCDFLNIALNSLKNYRELCKKAQLSLFEYLLLRRFENKELYLEYGKFLFVYSDKQYFYKQAAFKIGQVENYKELLELSYFYLTGLKNFSEYIDLNLYIEKFKAEIILKSLSFGKNCSLENLDFVKQEIFSLWEVR